MGDEHALGETKVTMVSRSGEDCKIKISVGGEDVEEVDHLKYLGVIKCDKWRWGMR